jgi:hypothetical protein
LNSIFAGYDGSKDPVQTRKKISSTNSIFQTRECQKSSADRYIGEYTSCKKRFSENFDGILCFQKGKFCKKSLSPF